MSNTFYITTPIYYVNALPHIGHAYTTIVCDVLARYHRLLGEEVFFLTGTDEHGQNIERKAQEAGKPVQKYCDEIASAFRDLWKVLNIQYDDFIRTSSERHKQGVRAFFQRVHRSGDIYLGTYTGWYCAPCETFYTDKDLQEGLCPVHNQPVDWLEEKNYFFTLSKYQQPLLEYIDQHPEFLQPDWRRQEMINVIQEGLKDFSISRSTIKWGIPLPIDPEQVIYVWFDALVNYLTALDFPDGERFRKFWPCDVHVIGKEIQRHHMVYWPAMLMSAGVPLPQCVFAHGWLTKDGDKISKTTGNIVDPLELVREFGCDAVRYYFCREVAFGKDGDYSSRTLISRINADLANNLGNMLNRTLGLLKKSHQGRCPAPPDRPYDDGLRQGLAELKPLVRENLEKLEVHHLLGVVWDYIDFLNKYIDRTQPWRLTKSEETRDAADSVMYEILEALRCVAILVYPVIPDMAGRMWQQLGLEGAVTDQRWEDLTWGRFPADLLTRPGEVLYKRIEVPALPPFP